MGDMEYRYLGNSGLQVSALSLGSWVTFGDQVKEDLAYDLMKTAYAGGVNFFDCAEIYGGGVAETIMGKAIARGIADGVWAREDLVVSTKLCFGDKSSTMPNRRGLSRKHLVQGMAASLRRLGLDYVDLVYAHRADENTPIAETVATFSAMIDRGQALYWGTSMWPAARIKAALAEAERTHRAPPVVEQPEYNLFTRPRVEVDYTPFTAVRGGAHDPDGIEETTVPKRTLGLTIWSPLADGVLTNKYAGGAAPAGSRMALARSAGTSEALFRGKDRYKVEQTAALAAAIPSLGLGGATPAQLAVAWTVANPAVTSCILGATSVKQLEETLAAMAVVPRLTPAVMAKIDRIMGTKPGRA